MGRLFFSQLRQKGYSGKENFTWLFGVDVFLLGGISQKCSSGHLTYLLVLGVWGNMRIILLAFRSLAH